MASRESVLEIKAVIGGDKVSYEDAELVTDIAIKAVTDAIGAMTRAVMIQRPDLIVMTAIVTNKIMQTSIEQDLNNFIEMLNEKE